MKNIEDYKKFLDNKQKNIKTTDDYDYVTGKTEGAAIGAIYQDKVNSDNAKQDIKKYMIKSGVPDWSHEINEVANNTISGAIYNSILGFRSPQDKIILDKNNNELVKSEFLTNFQTILEYLNNNNMLYSEFRGTEAKGFAEVMASALFLADVDPHFGNIGIITIKNQENEEIDRYFAKIDHGLSLVFSKDIVSARGGSPIEMLNNKYSDFYYGGMPEITVFDTAFISKEFAEACEKMSRFNSEHLWFSMEGAIDEVCMTFDLKEKNQKIEGMLTQIGVNVGKLYKDNGSDLNTEQLIKLYKDSLFEKLSIRQEEMQELANIVKIQVAVRNNNPKEIEEVIKENPELLTDKIYWPGHKDEPLDLKGLIRKECFGKKISNGRAVWKELTSFYNELNTKYEAIAVRDQAMDKENISPTSIEKLQTTVSECFVKYLSTEDNIENKKALKSETIDILSTHYPSAVIKLYKNDIEKLVSDFYKDFNQKEDLLESPEKFKASAISLLIRIDSANKDIAINLPPWHHDYKKQDHQNQKEVISEVKPQDLFTAEQELKPIPNNNRDIKKGLGQFETKTKIAELDLNLNNIEGLSKLSLDESKVVHKANTQSLRKGNIEK